MAEKPDASAAGAAVECLTVTVVHSSAPRSTVERVLPLPRGSTLADALKACGLNAGGSACGVWGRVVAPDQVLQDGDRVELYRPLVVDPKVARRERFARQGARSTGLFAQRRPGAKAGY
ncbi:RnfH family protein [Acidovorax sp. SUPP1855]|uniref:RnfH family protein n=1 Tax=Acidovorax sp. SUPP1855 TaxID=431774 RepID=UPI0023DE5A2E|nr:RnfH family protein [Acidovorax sp. SUPP1855]GKS84422.1 RnfH family protein [Acidovorax sp. SUPP1855]